MTAVFSGACYRCGDHERAPWTDGEYVWIECASCGAVAWVYAVDDCPSPILVAAEEVNDDD